MSATRPESVRARSRGRRWRGERGLTAGIEVLPFGVLVFFGITLLALNAWGVVTTKAGLDAAARDYLRAYSEAANGPEALESGERAARLSIAARLGEDAKVEILPPASAFGPCRLATVELGATVDGVHLPFVGDFGSTSVTSRQSELIDPYAPMEPNSPGLEGTICE